MKLWLDDWRLAPPGWWWAKDYGDAVRLVREAQTIGEVWEDASLDHDLGACLDCLGGRTVEEWLEQMEYQTMPHCEHVGTGYTFVCWMEEQNCWPKEKPRVHSMNAVGRKRMQLAIDRHYGAPTTEARPE